MKLLSSFFCFFSPSWILSLYLWKWYSFSALSGFGQKLLCDMNIFLYIENVGFLYLAITDQHWNDSLYLTVITWWQMVYRITGNSLVRANMQFAWMVAHICLYSVREDRALGLKSLSKGNLQVSKLCDNLKIYAIAWI